MKILVVGSGFLGKALIRDLESKGHELLVYSRVRSNEIESEQITGDIFSFNEFIKCLEWKPEVVIHTAWITTHGLYVSSPTNSKYSKFTSELATAILKTEIQHLVVLGSCAEYGIQHYPSLAGVTPLDPVSVYAKQKVNAFQSIRHILLNSNTRLTWARVFQPYGPGQDNSRLIPSMINSFRKNEPFHLKDETSIHDWITSRDVASAISWAINNALPTEIDVGTSNAYSNIELRKELMRVMNIDLPHHGSPIQQSGSKDVSSVSKDSPLFRSGWVPQYDLEAGLNLALQT